ncbi:MAG: bifunctional riboflavin kinase/FAD synthetase [Planctomycetaceae bacterium]|nr:bifunctional riboflavin kinase/FAD synthetase [Planctomycetaceae bacterium]MCB9953134.1 bifunctional riboflavin kinase/FAD synthetase [Planctomycetaceae bacterium]
MPLITGFTAPFAYRGGYVSIGNFDGVHRGHRVIVNQVVERARAASVPAVVVTFEPHPVAVLAPHRQPPRLTRLEYKAHLLEECGIDVVLAIEPTRELLAMSPREFFETILVSEMQIAGIVEGPNFCFGQHRAGTTETLVALADEHSIDVKIVSPETSGEDLVSSTAIRQALQAGNIELATQLLGRMHRVRGVVRSGAARGRTIGFPTANLADVAEMLPCDGVYAGIATVGDRVFSAAIQLGTNPTFDGSERKLEAHLLDFSGDIYGQETDVDFRHRLRDVVRFDSTDQLVRQLNIDIEQTRQLCDIAR